MVSQNEKYFPIVLNVSTAFFVILVSFLNYFKFSGSMMNFKLLGIIIVYVGMGIFIWAAIYLKKAISGLINPRLDYVVKNGPYRFCRHPVYFGITIALIGLAISLRSWLGIFTVLLLFIPSEIYRAKLEEKALADKFGDEWLNYVKNTSFFIPI